LIAAENTAGQSLTPVSLQFFILCRNRPDFAREAIRSALSQSVAGLDIVISDNSTNNAVEAMVKENFPRLTYRRRTTNFAALEHFNHCIAEVTADYFCLFHDDDILSPQFTQRVFDAIRRFPDAVAIGTNASMVEEGRPPRLALRTTGDTHLVCNARQLAEHYFSRHQPGIAPLPSYVYSRAKIGDWRFDPAGGKYADVSWLIGVASRGELVWIVEPLMTTRLHAGNDSREESIGDRLKLLAYFKRHVSTLGRGLKEDFRFFLYKKMLELERHGLRRISEMRRKAIRSFLASYRFWRYARIDHHRFLVQKMKVRLVRRFLS
jgi:glycosyltransferase involved in cell wall biosynthesis